MGLISNKALVEFGLRHPQAREPMQAWRKIIESRPYTNFAELKATFNAVDKVRDYTIFDIGGNKYRIVSHIHFVGQRLFVRHVFTYKEYDEWNP